MPIFEFLRRRSRAPSAVCASAALLLRLAVVLESWAHNPVVRFPQLDGSYYQRWASEIAGGDLLGTDPNGLLHGDPFFLNPLYAYLSAPLVALSSDGSVLPVLLLQCALGAATAALAAAAADRYFGRTAAWVAGIGVAFSTVLVQLDAHLSVSGLAACLVAGVVYSCAPGRPTDAPAGRLGGPRGPLASGIWLGLGALARPVAPLALPFVAWLHARRAPAAGRSRLRAVALVAAGLALVALPSLVRNWTVSGEPIPFTAANGANLHLGNNPTARRARSMASELFRFSPFEMHEDARGYVHRRLGRRPSWGEVSAEFRRAALDELLRHPGPSLAFYGQKARWLVGPTEVPSSASLWIDRDYLPQRLGYVPLLWLAWVPTWLLAALGVLGGALHFRRLDVLLGPGALVAAHAVALVLVFPLSHYRSPAIPALAVLAGGAIQWAAGAWRVRRRAVAAAAAAAAMVAVAGSLPPQPARMRAGALMAVAYSYRSRRDWDRADEYARLAQEMRPREFPDEPQMSAAPFLIGFTRFERALEASSVVERNRMYVDAIRFYREGLSIEPGDWESRLSVAVALMRLNRFAEALAEVEVIFAQHGTDAGDPRTWHLPPVHARYGEALMGLGRTRDARPHLEFAIRFGRLPRDRPAERFLPPDLRGPR